MCTVKQISDNKIYLFIKYTKSVLWRVGKSLSYIEDARCLKVNDNARYFLIDIHKKCMNLTLNTHQLLPSNGKVKTDIFIFLHFITLTGQSSS